MKRVYRYYILLNTACIHSRTVAAYVHYTADYRPKNDNRVNKILLFVTLKMQIMKITR